ncbi:HCP-like protein [Gigaspora margarita]|uniref:HCP-like protein n=1 Tax=Gigaspora margarita TaxID=4874 RepID=A0A8H4AXF4_GIGMA|nr:HCP-like protein [Gigaspora margarita]
MLAQCYYFGMGAEKDFKTAFNTFLELSKSKSHSTEAKVELSKSKSDQQNSANAKFELAHCYEFGKGITKDINKALQLYLDLSKSESLYQIHAF